MDLRVARSPDPAAVLDDEARCLELNAAFAALLGTRVKAAAGRPLSELSPPLAAAWKEARRHGRAELALTHGQATQRLELTALVDLQPGRHLLLARNVSALREREERLEQSETRYRLVARAASEALWDWDVKTNRSLGTEGVRALFGYAEEEVGETPEWWYEHIHPDDRERVRRSLDGVLAGSAGEWHEEYRYRRADGSYATVLDRACVLRDEAGRPARVVGSMLDVSASREAEEELRLQRSLLAAQHEALPDGVLVVSSAGRMLSFNRRFLEMWGLPAEVATGRSDEAALRHALARVADPDAFLERVRHLYDHPDESGADEVRLRDGRVFERLTAPVRGDGRHYGRVWLFRDVTERATLLASERASRAEAERANRLKDEFLATLSHELRTPLNAVVGWLHLLQGGQLGAAESKRALETVQRNVGALTQLISDMLDLSRISTGRLRLETAEVEIEKPVQAALESVQPAAQPKGLQISWHAEPRLTVRADPARLQQVAWNLFSNAVKFTPPRGHIEVSLRAEGTSAVLEVSDSGAGIPAAFLPHVFETFRQADGSATRPFGGLGLGLALVRQLVELQGGSVEASSAGEKQGATFRVKLPLAFPPAAAGARRGRKGKPAPAEAPILPGIRLLVVDDDPDTVEVLRVALSRQGAKVTTALSTREALMDLERHRPHLVITDIGMPGEDGYALLSHIKGRAGTAPPIPAIALTAHASLADRERALQSGFLAHVPKPVDPAELLSVLARVLGMERS